MKTKFLYALLFIFFAGFLAITTFQNVKKPARPARPGIGDKVPDFNLKSLDNKLSLSPGNLQGKVLFINFWATWCGPCREEMPFINNLKKIMANNKNFQMLTIAYQESPDTSLNYLQKFNYDLPLYFDPNGASSVNFGVTGVPETFIVGKTGIVAKVTLGPERWDSEQNLRLIASLLNQ